LLPDFSSWSRAFFSDDFPRDPAAIAKFWKDPKTPELLAKLADALEALGEWNHDACDHASRAVAEAGGVKPACLLMRRAWRSWAKRLPRHSSIPWSYSPAARGAAFARCRFHFWEI